jgi:hypothetical protein
MEKNNIYWFFVLLGILGVIIIYYKATFAKTNGIESFDGTSGSTTSGTPASGTPVSGSTASGSAASGTPASGTPPTMPQTNLLFYTHLFNMSNNPDAYTNSLYGNNAGSTCAANTLCNANGDSNIKLTTTYTSPVTSASGLPLLNYKIIGPPSRDLLGTSITTDILGSFSVIFYGDFNNLSLLNSDGTIKPNMANGITLYEAYAETPNSIKLSIMPIVNDQNNVNVQLILGDYRTYYNWKISVDTLKANGVASLYGLVFDNTNQSTPIATFYIGVNANPTNGMTAVNNTIKMGYSPMLINSNGTWDFNLYAFAYYTQALSATDITTLNAFFIYHYSNAAAAAAALQASQAQVQALQTIIDTNGIALSDLETQLQQCSTNLATCSLSASQIENAMNILPKARHSNWHVNNPNGTEGTPVSVQDMQKCDVLKIKDAMKGAASTAASTLSINNGLLANITPNSTGVGQILDPTKGQKPGPATASAPVTTPAAAASTAASSTNSNSNSNTNTNTNSNSNSNSNTNNNASFQNVYNQLALQAYQNPTSDGNSNTNTAASIDNTGSGSTSTATAATTTTDTTSSTSTASTSTDNTNTNTNTPSATVVPNGFWASLVAAFGI